MRADLNEDKKEGKQCVSHEPTAEAIFQCNERCEPTVGASVMAVKRRKKRRGNDPCGVDKTRRQV